MPELKAEPLAYIGRKKCGCIVYAAVDDPAMREDTAKEVAKLIRLGIAVERVTCQYVRDNMRKCTHGAVV